MKTFVFIASFFSFLSHRKHRTIKGGQGKTKEKFPCDAHLRILHLPILSSEISYSSIKFFSDRDKDLLVFEEFVLTEELGIRQCGLPMSEDHDSPEEFDSQISDRCCAMRQLSKTSTHLTVISLKGIYVLSCRAAP